MDERFKFLDLAVRPRYVDKDPNFFSGTDTKAVYEKNLKILPDDWHYRSKKIFYRRNSLGYRTKELSEVNQDNFFITYGCSFTEGVGLAEDETWPHATAELLDMDYLNYGLGGGGPETVYLNSLCFLKNSPIKPKFVIIQWPSIGRQITKYLDDFIPIVPASILDKTNVYPKAIEQFNWSVKTGSYFYDNYIAYMATHILWKTAGVPVYQWALNGEWAEFFGYQVMDTYFPTPKEKIEIHKARDLLHFGPDWSIRTGQDVARAIQNNPIFGFPKPKNELDI